MKVAMKPLEMTNEGEDIAVLDKSCLNECAIDTCTQLKQQAEVIIKDDALISSLAALSVSEIIMPAGCQFSDDCHHTEDTEINNELINRLESLNVSPPKDKKNCNNLESTATALKLEDEDSKAGQKQDSDDDCENIRYSLSSRSDPQENEDVQSPVLIAHGPTGGISVQQTFLPSSETFTWPVHTINNTNEYERQLVEPSRKFRKPSDSFVNQQVPLGYGTNWQIDSSVPNWQFSPGMQFASNANMSGGSVTVQLEQSPVEVGGLPSVLFQPNVLSQESAELIDELLFDIDKSPEILEEDLTAMMKFCDGDTRLDQAVPFDSSSDVSTDVGYYSPSHTGISSPGSAADTAGFRASPDNLSNYSGDSHDNDDLDTVLEYIHQDLLKIENRKSQPENASPDFMPTLFLPVCQSNGQSDFTIITQPCNMPVKLPPSIPPNCSYIQNVPFQQPSPPVQSPIPVKLVPNPSPITPEATSTQMNRSRTRFVEIRPKPPCEGSQQRSVPSNTCGPSCTGFYIPQPVSKSAGLHCEEDKQNLVKFCRHVAQFTTEQLLFRDPEADTLLHIAIAREKPMFVQALLSRLQREHLTTELINVRNMQQQTPLYMAVYMNQLATVRCLIEHGADANIQIHRHYDTGYRFYRPIHCAAAKGVEFSEVLEELMKAKDIDIHAINSEGRTALHCAIEAHDHFDATDGRRIDSLRNIYLLASAKADLGKPDGLSGKTPLHYIVEKKNADLLQWYLGLVQTMSAPTSPSQQQQPQLCSRSALHSIVNARTNSNNTTALHIACALQNIDPAQRIRIIALLLKNGAELSSKNDSLRKDLSKIPEIADLLKAACTQRLSRPS